MEEKKRDRDRGALGGAAHEVDALLRRHLEPHPLTAERLVRRALSEPGVKARPQTSAWPRFAVAAALLLAAFLIPTVFHKPPEHRGPVSPAVASQPVRISISNTEGFVTISSSAGSKWILVSGDDS